MINFWTAVLNQTLNKHNFVEWGAVLRYFNQGMKITTLRNLSVSVYSNLTKKIPPIPVIPKFFLKKGESDCKLLLHDLQDQKALLGSFAILDST